eukprot:14929634-Ditylum_brightwellii.AAC.1
MDSGRSAKIVETMKEEIGNNFPKPLGKTAPTSSTPVLLSSKWQGVIGTSTYGAEFIVGRHAAEEDIFIRYLMWLFVVLSDGPTTLYGDNLGLLQSSSVPEAT